jgi:hypothetical protein
VFEGRRSFGIIDLSGIGMHRGIVCKFDQVLL